LSQPNTVVETRAVGLYSICEFASLASPPVIRTLRAREPRRAAMMPE